MKAKDVRKGAIILYRDAPHQVLEFYHRTPGNLRAFVQMKLRSLLSGLQAEARFSSVEDLALADIYAFEATYLYADTLGAHFMNTNNYEELVIPEDIIGEKRFYLLDGMNLQVITYKEQPISVSLPKSVSLTVKDTTPDLKGATASNSPKPATTNTGLVVSVPPFIKVGDKIVVDTEDGSYLSRAD